MKEAFSIILGIDMETDVGSWTPEWRGLVEGTPLLLDLFQRNGVEATFYFTGEAAAKYPDVVNEIKRQDHDVGCHSLFHETLGDELFPLPNIKPVLPAEVRPRVERATQLVAQASGESPISFRAPRLWGSTHLINILESLGYTSDASYPLFFYRERFSPYHPSSKDWQIPGNMRILEIPNFADMSMRSEDPYHRDRDQWPAFRTKGAEYLLARAAAFRSLVHERNEPVVLCFYMHPWEFVPMPQSYSMNEADVHFARFLTHNTGETALFELEKLIQGLKAAGGTFFSARALASTYG